MKVTVKADDFALTLLATFVVDILRVANDNWTPAQFRQLARLLYAVSETKEYADCTDEEIDDFINECCERKEETI